jgi:hypothetical protein
MHISIQNQIVCENLNSFLELLQKAEAKREKKGAALFEKRYRAFLYRSSGKLIFADAYKETPLFDQEQWKYLFIDFSYDPVDACFYATAYEDTEGQEPFTFADLTPSAIATIKETIDVLNKVSSLLKGSDSDFITKIKALCKLQVEVEPMDNNKNILVTTWHHLDRLGAEKVLKEHPAGTFLFREDYYAKILGEQLTTELGKHIKCVTLTVREEEKVSDFTLVHIDHQWRCYNDALFCNVKGFFNIEDLLHFHFKDLLKHPLHREFVEKRKQRVA